MLGQTHVIDVGVRIIGLGDDTGRLPETETVDAIVALGDGKERLAIVALYPGDQVELAVELDGAGIEHRIDAQALHQERVGLRVEIITPVQRHMVRGQYRVLVTQEDAIARQYRRVLACQQGFLLGLQLRQAGSKNGHIKPQNTSELAFM